MAQELTQQEAALAECIEALRSARHMLENIKTTFLGVGYEPHHKSSVAVVVDEIVHASHSAFAALYSRKSDAPPQEVSP